MRTLFRIFIWTFTVLLIAAAILSWWFIYRPLPQLDGTVSVAGLRERATVDRDHWGVPRIRGASLEDAVEAQGYVMAQDRLWQLDLLRRASRGQLAEIAGGPALASDKKFRTLGFSRAADRDFASMDKGYRALLEAYARGVNAFISQHQANLPLEFKLLDYKPTPWLPTDSLVIAGYMYQALTDTWERELDRATVEARVGPDRAKDLFSDEAQMDHFVVGDPNVANDGSRSMRLDRDDEEDDSGSDDVVIKTSLLPFAAGAALAGDSLPEVTAALWSSVQWQLDAAQSEIRQSLGSNNWVVSGEHTATGKPILANDTHLELTIPPIWYEIHLSAPGYNAKGFTLPGAPLIVIGHNDHIAWGFTNNGADVQDLYIETFNAAAPEQYEVNGQWQAAQIFDEVMHVKNRADEHLKVVVTRHGPVVYHDSAGKSYALKWTALQSGGLSNTYSTLSLANNWQEFRESMKSVWGPGQNAVYADLDGNIGYLMAARVPLRKKGHGEVPVPGGTDDYEWTGYMPFDELPQALNPESGLIVTANARVVGPAYKPYLTDRWEEPYRTSRIHDLLYDKAGLRPLDMLKIETDTYSYPELFLAEQVAAAARVAQPKDARARQLVQLARDFSGMADADSPVVSFLVALRRAALDLILEPYLGKDTALYRWRSMAWLQKILTDRPSKWLPAAYKNYDELLAAAADRAVADLSREAHSDRVQDWQWKNFDSLEMLHPLGRAGFLKWLLSISGKPQSGTAYSVRAATPRHGPSMRFIANLANWDDSIMLIPAGESGELGSSHYTDQFSYWYEGKPIVTPYSDAAESKARKHTLTLTPAM